MLDRYIIGLQSLHSLQDVDEGGNYCYYGQLCPYLES